MRNFSTSLRENAGRHTRTNKTLNITFVILPVPDWFTNVGTLALTDFLPAMHYSVNFMVLDCSFCTVATDSDAGTTPRTTSKRLCGMWVLLICRLLFEPNSLSTPVNDIHLIHQTISVLLHTENESDYHSLSIELRQMSSIQTFARKFKTSYVKAAYLRTV